MADPSRWTKNSPYDGRLYQLFKNGQINFQSKALDVYVLHNSLFKNLSQDTFKRHFNSKMREWTNDLKAKPSPTGMFN